MILLALAVGGFWFGSNKYLSRLDEARFYQNRFYSSVAFVCTGEFRPAAPTAAVKRFLQRKDATLSSCEGVDEQSSHETTPLDRGTFYLHILAAAVWSASGISWASLHVIAGLFVAALAGASYGLLRLFLPAGLVGSLLAAGLTVAFLLTPRLIDQIPHLRDFSKGPFIIGSLALLAAAVLNPKSRMEIAILMFGAGILVATGLGFRSDIQVMLPIAVLAPLLLIGRGPWRESVKAIVVAWLCFGIG